MRRLASYGDFFLAGTLISAAALAALSPASRAAADRSDSDQQQYSSQESGPWRSAAWADIEIEKVTAVGNGCPHGSYHGYLADDGQRFYLQFAGFRPEVTPNQSSAEASCRLAIEVSVPAGLSYEIQSFSYLGYAYLESGVSAELSTSYYFQNDSSTMHKVTTTLKGPLDDIYEVEDKPTAQGIWSPCSRKETQTLNVQLGVKVINGKPARDGTLELNEALGMKLGWKKCR